MSLRRGFAITIVLGLGMGGSLYGSAARSSPAGCWLGTMGEGGERRRVVLELESGAAHAWSARFHRLSRNVSSDTVSATVSDMDLAFGNDQFHFKGRFSEDGASITGQIEREGKTSAVLLARPADDGATGRALVGDWGGSLLQNGVPVLRLVVKIRTAPCGQINATMDSPDQGATDLPVTSLQATADSLHLQMTYLGGAYGAAVDAAHTKLSGQWTQAGMVSQLDLSRGDSVVVRRRPQDPQKPYPYREEEVSYVSTAQGVKIAGTLTLPPGPGPFPAVLLLSGSGAQDRDEALMGHKPFLVIADHLTRKGIAVLRVDDRGVGGSTGRLFDADLEDNATDALAGVKFLLSRPDVAPKKVGLVGHSEGGWVAPIAAARSRDVAFIVMLAGPAVNGEELLYAQEAALSRARGVSESMIEASRRISQRMYGILKSEPDDSTAQRLLRAEITKAEAELASAQQNAVDSVVSRTWTNQATNQLQLLTTRWFRQLLVHDPAPELKKVRVPVLALYGERDLQVPPAQSALVLEKLLRGSKTKDYTVEVLPGLNHLFQHATSGQIDEYVRSEETFAPEALEKISTWIVERTR